MAKKERPSARAEARPDPARFRRAVRRNTGGRRVNPGPDEPQPEKEDTADE